MPKFLNVFIVTIDKIIIFEEIFIPVLNTV
jgi:hypothetical protein